MIRQLWAYRGFIIGSVKRDQQSKYSNSLLGAAWSVLNPVAMILVYTVIFAQVMRAKLPGLDTTFAYSIYLCAGVLTWGLFAEVVSRTTVMFVDNASILKKLSFPKLCLPAIVVSTAMVNFFIIFGLFTVFLIVSDNFPGWVFLAVVPLLIVQTLFAIGIGVTLSILNVFFRDVGQLLGIVIQFWFWLTPIVYPADILPKEIKPWIELNPMTIIMAGYQNILVYAKPPSWESLWPVCAVSIALCSLGLYLVRAHSGEMVDEL